MFVRTCFALYLLAALIGLPAALVASSSCGPDLAAPVFTLGR